MNLYVLINAVSFFICWLVSFFFFYSYLTLSSFFIGVAICAMASGFSGEFSFGKKAGLYHRALDGNSVESKLILVCLFSPVFLMICSVILAYVFGVHFLLIMYVVFQVFSLFSLFIYQL